MSDTKTRNVRIACEGPSTHGTQVTVDGVKVRGVTRIELVAAPGDVWKAVITLLPEAIDITDMDSDSVVFTKGLAKQDAS